MDTSARAEVDLVDTRTGFAFIGDRQAYLSRQGRTWTLSDDYGDEDISVTGSTVQVAVRRWADALGLPRPTEILVQRDPA